MTKKIVTDEKLSEIKENIMAIYGVKVKMLSDDCCKKSQINCLDCSEQKICEVFSSCIRKSCNGETLEPQDYIIKRATSGLSFIFGEKE